MAKNKLTNLITYMVIFFLTIAGGKRAFILYDAMQENNKAKTLNTGVILTIFLCSLFICVASVRRKRRTTADAS